MNRKISLVHKGGVVVEMPQQNTSNADISWNASVFILYNACPNTVVTTGTNDILANIHVVEISQRRTIIVILWCTFYKLQFYNVDSVCDGSTNW